MKTDTPDELIQANRLLATQKAEIEQLAAELAVANRELVFQNREKEKQAAELIEQNKELIQAKEQLEAVNRELEAFSYSVSHDLRGPLRGVSSYAQMLEEDYASVLDDNGKRLLGIIQKSAVKMGMLIDDLLSLSRFGKKEMRKSSVNITEAVNRVIEEINGANLYQAEIIVHSLHTVQADHALINHVLTNLLSNAFKYSAKAKNPRIEVTSVTGQGEIIFCVTDNGVGFEMEYAHKLFGVFQRLHSDKEFEGTGVGLAIVKRIIDRHGGRVWATGEPGKGACFCFSLPADANT